MPKSERTVEFTSPLSLHGRYASLVPLAHTFHDELVEALHDGEPWKLWYTAVPPPEQLGAEIDRRLGLRAQGSMLPFVAIEKLTGQAVGMTSYLNIDSLNRRVEIGATWYRRRVQRSALNTTQTRDIESHAGEVDATSGKQ